jgi:hypothetical protein
MSPLRGTFGLLDFTVVRPISPWYGPFHRGTARFTVVRPISPWYGPFLLGARFEIDEPFIALIFIFSWPC